MINKNEYKAHIILIIWLRSFYEMTVNHLAMGESVPRVPKASPCLDQAVQMLSRTILHRRDKSPVG